MKLQKQPGSLRSIGKVSLGVDAETRELAKQLAAQEDKPVSRWLRDTLKSIAEGDQGQFLQQSAAEAEYKALDGKVPSKRSQITALMMVLPAVMIDSADNVMKNQRQAAVMLDKLEKDAIESAKNAVKEKFKELRQGTLELNEINNV